jgi:hypothetical protein
MTSALGIKELSPLDEKVHSPRLFQSPTHVAAQRHADSRDQLVVTTAQHLLESFDKIAASLHDLQFPADSQSLGLTQAMEATLADPA